jgi:hypothetical protein
LRIFAGFSISGINYAYYSLRTAHSKKIFRHLTLIYIFLGPNKILGRIKSFVLSENTDNIIPSTLVYRAIRDNKGNKLQWDIKNLGSFLKKDLKRIISPSRDLKIVKCSSLNSS